MPSGLDLVSRQTEEGWRFCSAMVIGQVMGNKGDGHGLSLLPAAFKDVLKIKERE